MRNKNIISGKIGTLPRNINRRTFRSKNYWEDTILEYSRVQALQSSLTVDTRNAFF